MSSCGDKEERQNAQKQSTYRRSIRIAIRIGFVGEIPLSIHEGLADLLALLEAHGLEPLSLALVLVVVALVAGIKDVGRQLFLLDAFLRVAREQSGSGA